MNNIKEIFNNRLFRIPDYQRGYSWELTHLNDFWQDLINLPKNRVHYTGMISVEKVQKKEYSNWIEDIWIIDGRNDTPFFIVDGQQRLTTILILLWVVLDQLEDGQELSYESKEAIQSKYIFAEDPKKKHKSYIFGYHRDNPSYEFLKQEIFEQAYSVMNPDEELEQTAYTNNLLNAKAFFIEKISGSPLRTLEQIYDKVTKRLVFDFKILEEELDIFIVFETMNNRGKPLSNLEKLKNRLIYLSTLLKDSEDEEKKMLRERINEKWKVIYKYLGLNKDQKLDDDSFLQSHWIMYRRYQRREPEFYAADIFDTHFTIQRALSGELTYSEIEEYINSIASSARMWFVMFNPNHFHAAEIIEYDKIITWLKKQNRLGFKAFAPLILAALTSVHSRESIFNLVKSIEAYVFLIFNVSQRRSNTGTYHFNALANQLYSKALDIETVIKDVDFWIYGDSTVRGYFDNLSFYSFLKDLFLGDDANGYQDWKYLRYFLYEYEIYLRGEDNKKDVDWEDARFVHRIMPKNPQLNCWVDKVIPYSRPERCALSGSLGNFVLSKINYKESCFDDQKVQYEHGFMNEREIMLYSNWSKNEIMARGIKMLKFMEDRWKVDLGSEDEKLRLLFVDY